MSGTEWSKFVTWWSKIFAGWHGQDGVTFGLILVGFWPTVSAVAECFGSFGCGLCVEWRVEPIFVEALGPGCGGY